MRVTITCSVLAYKCCIKTDKNVNILDIFAAPPIQVLPLVTKQFPRLSAKSSK